MSDPQHQDASMPERVTVEARERRWLIKKGPYFYRPNACGYTTQKGEAGRWSEAEARALQMPEDFQRDAVVAIPEDEVPDDALTAALRERDEAREAHEATRQSMLKFGRLGMEHARRATAAEARLKALREAGAPAADALDLVVGSLDFNRDDDVSKEVIRRVNNARHALRSALATNTTESGNAD